MGPGYIIYILGMVVGLIICGGATYAMIKQKVVVDDAGEISSVEIPFLGKLKTNYPSLLAVFIGAGLVGYIVSRSEIAVETASLEATLTIPSAANGNHVFVAAIPTRYLESANAFQAGEPSTFKLTVDKREAYNVVGFMVADLRDGKPIYALTHGPALIDGDKMIFAGELNNPVEQITRGLQLELDE